MKKLEWKIWIGIALAIIGFVVVMYGVANLLFKLIRTN